MTQFRKDIKHRVKELNEEGDAYSDKQVAQVLEASAGKGLVIDAKWKWADDYFAEDSGHLDCELKAEMVLADFNQETKFNWPPKKMTQHLNAYCQFADHLQCLNPVSITHKQKDGERWIKRDGDPF